MGSDIGMFGFVLDRFIEICGAGIGVLVIIGGLYYFFVRRK
jgi:hypothetical protein